MFLRDLLPVSALKMETAVAPNVCAYLPDYVPSHSLPRGTYEGVLISP